MIKLAKTKRCCLLALLFFMIITAIHAQKPVLPKNTNQSQKVITPTGGPVIKKDSEKYESVPTTVATSNRIATVDELYLSNGSFVIRTARDYRYLTYFNPDSPDGRVAVIWEYTDRPIQQFWNFILQPGGFYKIKSLSGLYLMSTITTGGGYITDIRAGENTDNFLWQLEESGDGYYYVRSKEGIYLELNVSPVTDGSLISMSANTNGSANKKWHLIKMSNDQRKITSFIPERDGFRFVNTFNGEDVIKWGGLCGGMVYAAMDYFRTGIPIPIQTYTPANATTLQSYIFQRQQHSMWNVNEKWSELEVAYRVRTGEIYRWGIQGFGGGRLEELKNAIDANRSVPIGLFGGEVPGINNRSGGNHVMLAVGYSLGRYRGDFAGQIGDFKILAYDPNERNRIVTLVPDITGQCFFEVESGLAWRTYFVNNKYDNEHNPPGGITNFPEREPEGSIRHLYAEFRTGGDDLRGNNDNVSITISYRDGSTQHFGNVNERARWIYNSTQTVHLGLNRPVRKSDILHFTITTTFGDGFDSDDWNLDGFIVTSGFGGIEFARSVARSGSYIFRFSGDQHMQRHTVPVR